MCIYLGMFLSSVYFLFELLFCIFEPWFMLSWLFWIILCNLFLVLLYVSHHFSFLWLRMLVTSDFQNGIPIRIIQGTFPICWGSNCGVGLKPQNLCFPNVSRWFWCRWSLELTFEKFCWSESVKMAWKGSLP